MRAAFKRDRDEALDLGQESCNKVPEDIVDSAGIVDTRVRS